MRIFRGEFSERGNFPRGNFPRGRGNFPRVEFFGGDFPRDNFLEPCAPYNRNTSCVRTFITFINLENIFSEVTEVMTISLTS